MYKKEKHLQIKACVNKSCHQYILMTRPFSLEVRPLDEKWSCTNYLLAKMQKLQELRSESGAKMVNATFAYLFTPLRPLKA